MSTILSIEHVHKLVRPNFWNKPILLLNDINFELKSNQIMGFIGSNGAGKTSLIKCMLDLYQYEGLVKYFDGKPFEQVKHLIGFMPEQALLYPFLEAEEILTYFARLYYNDDDLIKQRIQEVISLTKLTNYKNKKIAHFSKGMSQRLSLASAMIHQPKLLILDEPMSGLDPLGRSEFKNIFLKYRENGGSIFFSTHILSDIASICDSVGIIKAGKIVAVLSIRDLGSSIEEVEESLITKYQAFE